MLPPAAEKLFRKTLRFSAPLRGHSICFKGMLTMRSPKSAGKVLFISPLTPTLAGILWFFIMRSTLESELIPEAASA